MRDRPRHPDDQGPPRGPAQATRRSKSYVIEEALEQYLDANEWQINGVAQALAEADAPDAVFIDHQEVLAEWETKVAR